MPELLTMREKRALCKMCFHVPNPELLSSLWCEREVARTLACELGLYLFGFALDLMNLNYGQLIVHSKLLGNS